MHLFCLNAEEPNFPQDVKNAPEESLVNNVK